MSNKQQATLGGALSTLKDAAKRYREDIETGSDATSSRTGFMIVRGLFLSGKVRQHLGVDLSSVAGRTGDFYEKLTQKGTAKKHELIELLQGISSDVDGILINLDEDDKNIRI